MLRGLVEDLLVEAWGAFQMVDNLLATGRTAQLSEGESLQQSDWAV
jgi:hypothetical protein